MKIWIFGDSFSTNTSNTSWISLLKKHYEIEHHSFNGISEYRIYKEFKKHTIDLNDIVIICHTNPLRIFIPDHVKYPSRKLDSHKFCDLVITDAFNNGWFWKLISNIFYRYFFDQEYYETVFDMFINDMRHPKIINITGFENNKIFSFYEIFLNHRGNINHMTEEGNKLLFNMVKNKINDFL